MNYKPFVGYNFYGETTNDGVRAGFVSYGLMAVLGEAPDSGTGEKWAPFAGYWFNGATTQRRAHGFFVSYGLIASLPSLAPTTAKRKVGLLLGVY